ncbi:hypothetical protein [Spongiactinospora sp. 9N601]|uniref:hypothetical protein n=1 Tax=Spongiactinospora sp. 9N601 TaxID=3375149 RepID=UPI0037895518
MTGGNAGTGYFIAEQFAAAGATVIIGSSRSPAKAVAAVEAVTARVTRAPASRSPM